MNYGSLQKNQTDEQKTNLHARIYEQVERYEIKTRSILQSFLHFIFGKIQHMRSSITTVHVF
jgi:hypothetical protein